MASILVIGDSHLEHCYNIAVKEKKLNFGYNNLNIIWKVGIDQISAMEEKYKEAVAHIGPITAVFIMCGGYDFMTIGDSRKVVDKLKNFVHHINSSNVNSIVVCSLLERKCVLLKHEEEANKGIRMANKALARAFKNQKKISFINIRPSGKVKDIIDDDNYHLKEAGYDHVFRRISLTLEEKIITNISQSVNGITKEVQDDKGGNKVIGKDASLNQRLQDFKETLLLDYKRICAEEKDTLIKLKNIQKRLETTTKEKDEVVQLYEKLFSCDLTQLDE